MVILGHFHSFLLFFCSFCCIDTYGDIKKGHYISYIVTTIDDAFNVRDNAVGTNGAHTQTGGNNSQVNWLVSQYITKGYTFIY